ncbi:hypothetical protein [Streptomyces sp. NPDC001966]
MENGLASSVLDAPATSREQDAVRLLLLIRGAGQKPTDLDHADPGLGKAVGVVRTQVRLQKLDFLAEEPRLPGR